MSLKRHELRKLSNEKHRDPLNDKIRVKYHTTLQQYKKLLNHKRSEYYNLKISELENITYNSSSDTRTFWNCVNPMDDSIKYEVTPPISEANWLNYFSNSLIIHVLMTQSACINWVRCMYFDTQ